MLTWADYSYVQPASSLAYVRGRAAGYFVLRETISPLALGRRRRDLRGVFIVGHTHPRTTEPVRDLREIVLYMSDRLRGTGGELCVSRAMKTIGEVTDFRPAALVRVVGRAMRVGWMWIGITLMALAFFALLGMLSLDNVSFVVPVTALSYAAGALGSGNFSRRARHPQRWAGVFSFASASRSSSSAKDSRMTGLGHRFAMRFCVLALRPFVYYVVAIIRRRSDFSAARSLPRFRALRISLPRSAF